MLISRSLSLAARAAGLAVVAMFGLGLSVPRTADADTILDPSVGGSSSTSFGSTTNLVNQSHLSATYTSGVTDFTSYTGSTTYNQSSLSSGWGVNGNSG